MPTTTEMARAAGVPIIPFDHHAPEFAAHHAEICKDILEKTPLAWSEAYGGFWYVSKYDDVRFVLENWERFSSENRLAQGDLTRRGTSIPAYSIELPLNHSDPPSHTRLRMIEAPYFTPKYLRRWMDAAGAFTRRSIDSIIEKGEGDLVKDICARVPVMTTLCVGGADPEEWEFYSNPLAFAGGPDGDAYLAEVMDKLEKIILDRRENPREDMATALANAKVDGEPLPTKTAVGMLHIVLTGGFDTAISILSDAFYWLGQNPEKRAWLRGNPDMIDNATDEFMRMWPPVVTMARTVAKDQEFAGVTLREGDWIAFSIEAANHDPNHFENPYEVLLDRKNARDQLAFSAGNHRCLGAPLGRVEMHHVIKEVLRRIPDYKIDESRIRRKAGIHPTRGWESMPVTFTPGRREG